MQVGERSTINGRTRPRASWRGLVEAAGGLTASIAAATGLWLSDVEALAVAVLMVVALVWYRRRSSRLALAAVVVLLVNSGFWNVAAAASGISHDDPLRFVALVVAQSVVAAVGLVAVAGVISRSRPGRAAVRRVALGGVVAFTAVLAVSVVPGVGEAVTIMEGDVVVDAENTEFSPDELTVAEGRVTVVLDNHDYFWHTFTIDELDVDLRAPVGGVRRASFDAAPGKYDFYCSIPGHDQAGMNGVLVVR